MNFYDMPHRRADFYPHDAMLARVLAVAVCLCVFVCLCVCLSFTRRYCINTAKHRITQTCHVIPQRLYVHNVSAIVAAMYTVVVVGNGVECCDVD